MPLHYIGHVKVVAYHAFMFILVPKKYVSFLFILRSYVNNIRCTGVVSAYEATHFFLISKWIYQPLAFTPVEVFMTTYSLTILCGGISLLVP